MDRTTREYLRRQINERRRDEISRGLQAPDRQGSSSELMIPVDVLFTALETHARENGWYGETVNSFAEEIAEVTGYDPRRITLMMGQQGVTFDVADYIISKVDVTLWQNDPGLRVMFEQINLLWYEPDYAKQQRLARNRERNQRNRDLKKAEKEKAAKSAPAKEPLPHVKLPSETRLHAIRVAEDLDVLEDAA